MTYLLQDYQGNHIKVGFHKDEILRTQYPNTYLVEKVKKNRGNKAYVNGLDSSIITIPGDAKMEFYENQCFIYIL